MMLPAVQAGRALLHMAVSYSPVKGGEADVEQESPSDTACPVFRSHHDDATYHKSVLTARRPPSG